MRPFYLMFAAVTIVLRKNSGVGQVQFHVKGTRLRKVWTRYRGSQSRRDLSLLKTPKTLKSLEFRGQPP